MPARPAATDEPAVLYAQPDTPDLLLGLYGSETRLRNWTPALRSAPMPAAARNLTPRAPVPSGHDHQFWPQVDLAGLPIPKSSPRDAGRYVTMGFVLAEEPDQPPALSAHRMLVLDQKHLGISMLSSRHLRHMAQSAWDAGRDLPISINIGVPPAVAIASATATAHLPVAFDKLSLAGGLAQAPVLLSRDARAPATFLSSAEVVLHGVLTPETCAETLSPRPKGVTMPEFLGYDGQAGADLQVIRLSAISQRPGAVFQATLGPGREQSAILGLGGSLALSLALSDQLTDDIADLHYSSAGGGMLLLYVALKPEAKVNKAGLARDIITVMPFTKTIVFVDSDIDLTCDADVNWAMTTRCNLARDCHELSGFPPLRMDPSQTPNWQNHGGSPPCRSWIDATCPASLLERTRRSF
ncbi:UbiD family decarboxylase [Aliiroseovarius crassostreae]|uniref:UbiD family decarboxylase n=1 Tax=Aliiroseovarius crassostreae TaxID=154981 RepID=UPI0021FAA575|nr:UbiD family decarboxylase [Aliiroseovarius crassostreae]UWP90885.1 UbiD family decarboxylase [Aliiroseovarius crassostreae]